MKTSVLLLFFAAFVCLSHSSEEDLNKQTKSDVHSEKAEGNQKFVATNEWQTIPEGQGIPRGLHVRIDMQTGKKEAKLLEEETPPTSVEDTQHTSALIHSDVQNSDEDDGLKLDRAEIKEALKKIKNDAQESSPHSEGSFRSYEEIKEQMKDLEMNIKTETEIIKDLVAGYPQLNDDSLKTASLGDLEFYVHQYDNALDFVKMGGFKNIILPALNSTNSELRSAAAFLLGSACQSNPKVQIAALEIGSLPYLIRLVTFDQSPEVRNRALYAISGIVRNFPLAQKALVEFGAISAFTTIFQTDSAELTKLQLKIVTLLSDITSERSSAIAQHSEAVNATEAEMKMLQEKVQQYESAGVETVLVEQGFCRLFPRLLTQIRQDKMARREDLSSFQGRPLREEHDVVEKVVQAMISLSRSCRAHFRSVTSLIQTLNDRYEGLASQEKTDQGLQTNEDLYYTQLYRMCNQLLKEIQRDEL